MSFHFATRVFLKKNFFQRSLSRALHHHWGARASDSLSRLEAEAASGAKAQSPWGASRPPREVIEPPAQLIGEEEDYEDYQGYWDGGYDENR